MELSRRGFLTVSTAVGLSSLYGAYAQFVNPLVTPTLSLSAAGHDFGPIQRPKDSREIAERWLPSQPWAARADYQLRTGEAFVYFNEWEPTDSDKAVRLKPFALVWMTEGDDGAEPIRISCDSAYLQFPSEFKMPIANPGRVIGGELEGKVRIQGKDGLDIVGKNFVFSESAMRIWSDNHVQFKHGPHRGHAMQLQMELIPDETAGPNDAVAVSGVKSVRLRKNVVMDMQLDEELPSARKSATEPLGKAKPSAPVNIRSNGSFSFVTETNVATFEDTVRVRKPVGPDEYDELECDKLTLIFEPGDDDAETQPDPDSVRFEGISGNLTFQRLLAVGKKVILVSKTNDMRSYMDQLEYNATDGLVVLTDKKRVRVFQGESELNAPEVSLLQDEEGAAKSVWCRGAGQLTFHDKKSGEIQLHAKWAKQLRKYPDPHSDLDVIELDRDAIVRQPLQQSGLAADFIKLWVEPHQKDSNASPALAKRSKTTEQESQQIRIDRMLALKNVVMISPEMHADTDRLEVWFEKADLPPQPETTSAQDRTYQGSTAAAETGNNVAFTQTHSDGPVKNASGSGPQENPFLPGREEESRDNKIATAPVAKKKKEPAVIVCDLIRARILHDADRQQSQVAEIWTHGNVEVTQPGKIGEPPLRISGDRMHMQNQSEADQLVHVFGAPAHIRDRQMHIQGSNVHLDRNRNHAWVDGEGLLQLPVTSDLDGKPLKTPQVLDVWWRDKMAFDGETAKFLGDVLANLEHSRMRCPEMEVLLTERISFADVDRDKRNDEDDKVDIKYVICKGGVDVESREYVEKQLAQIRRARFHDLTLNQETGKQLANGPGWITVWRKTEGDRAGLSSNATVRANKPLQNDTTEWEYSRIDFAGKSDGNMTEQFTTFSDRVEVVHGPVDQPLETIDPDDLPDSGGWMRCAKMQLTQFKKTDTTPAYIKMLGSGNAELEGRMPGRGRSESRGESFRARADTISFDESKGLYILRSRGNRTATVWRQKHRGGEYSNHDAKRIEFIPALNQLKSNRASGTIGIE